jgi:hypothetical protein
MVRKRGQITIFIIVGMVILIIFGIIYSFIADLDKDPNLQIGLHSADKNPNQAVNAYLNSLLKSVTYDSIKQVALSGGEFNPSDYQTLTVEGMSTRVGYALKNNNNLLSGKNIKDELSKAILFNLKDRIDLSFIEAEGGNYSIDWNKATCTVSLTKSKVNVIVNLPIKMELKGAKSYTLPQLQTDLPVELLNVYNIINKVVDDISASSVPYDLSADDYSCNLVRICYNGNHILRVRQYKPIYDEPGLLFLVAVDKEPTINRCTRLDNINGLNGGSC